MPIPPGCPLPRRIGAPAVIGVPVRGFTLLEALLALAIASVLLGIAIPAFSDAIASTRTGSARAALYDSVIAAGNHATITATQVVLCPSIDGQRCNKSMDWHEGWIVFSDRDGNRERGPFETLVRRQDALPDGTRLRSTSGRTRLVFQALGSSAGSNATFTLCHRRSPDRATTVVLANNGRIRQGQPSRKAANDCKYGG